MIFEYSSVLTNLIIALSKIVQKYQQATTKAHKVKQQQTTKIVLNYPQSKFIKPPKNTYRSN